MNTFSTLARYGLVGISNTGTTIAAMAGLAYLGIPYTIYTAVGYLLGFIVSYTLNGIFTFHTQLSQQAFILFVGINGGLLIFVEIVQFSLIEWLSMPELTGVAMGMVVYMLMGFFLNRHFVYRKESESPQPQ